MNSNSKGVFLDVDSSIVENNLRFATTAEDEELNKIFKMPDDPYPSKLIKPFPGFCIKTKEIGTDNKFFVNICKTNAIPAPKDITETELMQILESDEPSTFRVPMSIGEVRTESDKKGEEARVCDVAIHPDFFNKVETVPLFRSFFTTIVFEGLKEKYGIICHDEKIILKNRKTFGILQMHRIQQREIDEKMKKQDENKLLIEEIKSSQENAVEEPRKPEFRLFRKRSEPNCIIGEFKFPDIISANEITLDIGEDRILIEASSRNYLLDIFIPHIIRQSSCSSTFNKSTKMLQVKMPLVGG